VGLDKQINLLIVRCGRGNEKDRSTREYLGAERMQVVKIAKESNLTALCPFGRIRTMNHCIVFFP
jgi:hypothetical protein